MASNSLQLDYAIVDVFTHTKYAGNPLAIVRVPKACALSQEQKQTIAREFNLSETAFLHEKVAGSDSEGWTVDIFTVKEELPFAGHPTVGTACFVLSDVARELGENGHVDAMFNLKAGPVQLKYDAAEKTAQAAIPHDVRIHKQTWSRHELFRFQPRLAEAYHKGEVNVKDQFPIVSIVKGMTFVLVELESLEALQRVGLSGLSLSSKEMGLDEGWSRTFVGMYFFIWVGNGSDGEKRLRTRMIEGTLEDPATGSAASALAAYLSLVEGAPYQRLVFTLTQGVEMGRRSDIHIQVLMKEESGIDKVILGGGAVQVMEGRLTI
ncbi:Diaminopimelate epimerase-like protein [Lentithecium fluviatile CBS 122367]|uniref:Diaminopimelate epimerase-like protein n=1 Tax=Lentithecium fluviatile CBS 122367 TaxID=1168545 RepID=A0A6G1JBJ2_9PLEO|nr:Diaminopimelate epimerase-like protein [Lentithecium fluviatile CBS 122367]